MILQKEEILAYIQKPENDALIRRARDILASHRLHVKGIGLDEFLSKIEGYENKEQHELRRKLAKRATVPIFGKEMQEFSKVFTAQGFSRYFKFQSSSQDRLEADLKEYLATDVGEGKSMVKWMKEVWEDKVNYDSTGLFMVELPTESNGTIAEPYLTFRSILEIHDIALTGNKVEYVIFCKNKWDKEAQKYYKEFRVVDDAFDYILRDKDGEVKFVEELTIPNPWKYVPAKPLSNQNDDQSKAKTSYIWKAVDIGDEYLLDASIHTITKKLHGFPIKWMMQRGCTKCKGKGRYATGSFKEDNVTPVYATCGDCSGTGVVMKSDVSDVILVPQPDTKDDAQITDPAGYVQPDIDSLENQVVELDRLEKIIHMGIWSSGDKETSQVKTDNTATATLMNVQNIWAKLLVFSENAEDVERFITNAIAQVRYGTAFIGSIINYGKKYFIRTADEVELLYQTAKKAGMPTHILDAYVEEMIYLKFGNDPVELQRQLMLNRLEPFIHLSPKEVQDLNVPMADYLMKCYFTDYIERYEEEEKPIEMSTHEEILETIKVYNIEKLAELKAGETSAGTKDTNTAIDTLGKIPLALQQLALAQERAMTNGNAALGAKIGKKMAILTEKLAE